MGTGVGSVGYGSISQQPTSRRYELCICTYDDAHRPLYTTRSQDAAAFSAAQQSNLLMVTFYNSLGNTVGSYSNVLYVKEAF